MSPQDEFTTEIKKNIIDNNIEKVKSFFEYVDINCSDELGFTPLMYVLEFQRTDLVNYFIENGANPLAHSSFYDSPLSTAIRNFNEHAIKKLLLSYSKSCTNKLKNIFEGIVSYNLEELLLFIHSITKTSCYFENINPKIISICHREARNALESLDIELWD